MFVRMFAIATLAMLVLFPVPGHTASSPWQDIGGGKARLVAVEDPETGSITAIVEIALMAGWKTYWRSPGDSGIPPEFDFSRSTSFEAGAVAFPVPEWIMQSGSGFYGYRNTVSFITTGTATDPDASIGLDLLIGVCEEICIPATASFDITTGELNQSDPKAEILVELARSRLPRAADNGPKLSDLMVVDGMFSGTIEGLASVEGVHVVIDPPGRWISDPLNVLTDSNGNGQFSGRLPDWLNTGDAIADGWHYSILRREPAGNVSLAVEGSFKVRGE